MNIKVLCLFVFDVVLVCQAADMMMTPNPVCEPSSDHSKRELVELKNNYIYLVNKLSELVADPSYSQFTAIAEDFFSLFCTLTGGMEELVATNQSTVYKATLTEVVPRISLQIFATDVSRPKMNSCESKRTVEVDASKWLIRDSRYCIVQRIESKVYYELNGGREEFTCWSNEGMNYVIPVFHRALELVMQRRLVEFCNYVHVVIRESIKIPEMVADEIQESYF
ncbi:hypothetical protein ACFFRR_006331 [Megaselia abdita]